MKARRIARELALLSVGQLSLKSEKLSAQQLQNVVLAAIHTLTTEVQDALEAASAELERGSDRLLTSETRAVDLNSAKAMVKEAIDLADKAINRVGMAVDLPEFIQQSNQKDVRDYTLELLNAVHTNREDVDRFLNQAMVNWRLDRLARIDQDILRIAVTEMQFLGVPDRVAINEAVELAKRYSGDDGHSFINGILRRVTDKMKQVESPTP